MLLGMIILFLVIALVWAHLTEIDEVTRGQGKVVPSRSLQVVQSLEGGVVQEIRVSKGDRVETGDVLLILRGGVLEGGYEESLQRYHTLQVRMQRLRAEVVDIPLEFTSQVVSQAPDVVDSETRLFEGRKAELDAELRVLSGQRRQREREHAEQQVALSTVETGITLARAERDLIQPLVERGLEPELSLLQIRRTLNELQGERARIHAALERVQASIEEVDDRKQALRQGFRAQALSDLSLATGEASELEKLLPAKADQVERTRIRSPVDGVVNQLHLSTVGGVARPGDPLVDVVPADDALLVEAHIHPRDIGFLYPGQPVRVQITAYDFARYGALDGELVTIGADAVEVQGVDELLYPVRVRTQGHLYDADERPLDIIPGMVAEVHILGGKRSVLDYLLEPVVKVRDRAFRD
ncbi:HlyD family type I secretion periplasmic adaptor subunit [Ectothiorhodospira variabilis]|uniref:HlyD family type I secretion periplasmic adaptor subunit n=1 Tax=Ectothiorhodospira variabilis TaxID=505694 RepID=UPI001EFAE2B2|nr:HlyD family type I secretion periplasmic adaptor subunit [Ectothiorhodospira variabilis]MCG5495785.1 HlyD family type I secretion periplasmic adaptor subunit [Ectothiorhodospira variabilis]MCG5505188.1 HlyD family type I secretion periplasmic adaptor subunit [Ectothiorhodospira variabilis]MCG5508375.1 HlyD family type I secretion periplasmic adaptor subunit [Ectothiorhodospira variabilis]